jgi:hypothetical protein
MPCRSRPPAHASVNHRDHPSLRSTECGLPMSARKICLGASDSIQRTDGNPQSIQTGRKPLQDFNGPALRTTTSVAARDRRPTTAGQPWTDRFKHQPPAISILRCHAISFRVISASCDCQATDNLDTQRNKQATKALRTDGGSIFFLRP